MELFNQDEVNVTCQRALKHFGVEKQLIKLVEELAELQKETCRLLLDQREDKSFACFHEELADVLIMLNQVIMWRSVTCDMQETLGLDVKFKIDRLNELMDKTAPSLKPVGPMCPSCGSHNTSRQRRPNGFTECKDCDFICSSEHWEHLLLNL